MIASCCKEGSKFTVPVLLHHGALAGGHLAPGLLPMQTAVSHPLTPTTMMAACSRMSPCAASLMYFSNRGGIAFAHCSACLPTCHQTA